MLKLIRRHRRPGTRRAWTLPLIIVAALALLVGAGCGDDSGQGGEPTMTEPATTAPAETVPPAEGAAVRAEMREFAFEPANLTVRRGGTLEVENVGSVPHNLTIERGPDAGADTDDLAATSTFGAGRSEELGVDLPPGTYALVCTVPGHREAGMVGTITVRE